MTSMHDPDEPAPLPQDIPAEQSVLGAMMLSKNAIADVVESLHGPADFYRPAHQVIYQVILDLYVRGEPADPVATSHELEAQQQLTRVGGGAYLHDLISTVPTATNAAYYADIVRQKALLRGLVQAGTRITQLGYQGTAAAGTHEVVARASEALEQAITESHHTTGRDVAELLQPTIDHLEAIQMGEVPQGIPTGYHDLDDVIGGLKPGKLVVVAGRPGSGKSTTGLDWARSAAIHHAIPTMVVSLEMDATEVTMRLLAAESQVRFSDMQHGKIADHDWSRLAHHMGNASDAPLHIDDSPNLALPDIRARARRMHAQNRLGLLVVDYLQLVSSSGRVESRQNEVSQFSRNLKLLAKELNIPVVVLAQLNRGPEQRTDKKPQLADLRESGAIEQDSDVVVLVHRPDAYQRDDPRMGEVDLIVAKHRAGPTATVTLAHQLHYCRFVSLGKDSF